MFDKIPNFFTFLVTFASSGEGVSHGKAQNGPKITYVACKFREGVGRNPGSGNSGGESPFFSFPPKVANPKIAKITILP